MEQSAAANTTKKPPLLKSLLSLAVALVLVALTLFLMLRGHEWRHLWKTICEVQPLWLVLGLLMVVVCIGCEGECLRQICGSLGHRIRPRKAFAYACIDYYFSTITPSATGGQPAMLYYMSQDGIPLSKSGIAVLLTTGQYTAALLVLGVIMAVTHLPFLLSAPPLFIGLLILGAVLNGLLFAACLLSMFRRSLIERLGGWLLRLGARLHLVRRLDERLLAFHASLDEYEQGAAFVRTHPALSARVFLLCTVQRLSILIVTFFVYKGFHLHGVSLFHVLAIQTLVTLSVCTLPLPGAVGAAEGMFLLTFGAAFPERLLMAAMLLTRGVTYYFCLLLSGTVTLGNHLFTLRRRFRRQRRTEEVS